MAVVVWWRKIMDTSGNLLARMKSVIVEKCCSACRCDIVMMQENGNFEICWTKRSVDYWSEDWKEFDSAEKGECEGWLQSLYWNFEGQRIVQMSKILKWFNKGLEGTGSNFEALRWVSMEFELHFVELLHAWIFADRSQLYGCEDEVNMWRYRQIR